MVKSEIGSLFENEWCPLFGDLPEIKSPPAAIDNRCIKIIEEARIMWDAIPKYQAKYPAGQLTAAKLFFDNTEGIQWNLAACQTLLTGNSEDLFYYKKDDGSTGQRYAADQIELLWLKPEEYITINATEEITYPRSPEDRTPNVVIWPAYSCSKSDTDDDRTKKIPVYKVLAILSIDEAWNILRRILINGDQESAVVEAASLSRSFLERAKDLKKIERLAKEKAGASKGGKKSAEIKKAATAKRNADLKIMVQKEMKAHQDWGKSRTAEKLEKEETVKIKASTIRRIKVIFD